MAQKDNTEYGNRVWSGDPKTVAEAREKYNSDPKENLIPLAIALYSFRGNKKFARELLQLRTELLSYARKYIGLTPENYHPFHERADTADVLSTYFEWMSRQKELFLGREQRQLLEAAEVMCHYGIRNASGFYQDSDHNHTRALLMLTSARILMSKCDFPKARAHLDSVARYAFLIKDANQRARVYRKLGMLYRESGRFTKGTQWGVKACLVPNVPLAVRAKSAVALLGVDR